MLNFLKSNSYLLGGSCNAMLVRLFMFVEVFERYGNVTIAAQHKIFRMNATIMLDQNRTALETFLATRYRARINGIGKSPFGQLTEFIVTQYDGVVVHAICSIALITVTTLFTVNNKK